MAAAAEVPVLLGWIVALVRALATGPQPGLTLPPLLAYVTTAALVLGLVGGAIAVPMWMYRAYRNLPALGEQGMTWSPGWAAGGWFVPFANFVIPYLCLRDLWRGCGDERPLPKLYLAAWIASYVLLIPESAFFRAGPRPLRYVTAILSDATLIVTGLVLITMIRRISRRQRERQTELRDG